MTSNYTAVALPVAVAAAAAVTNYYTSIAVGPRIVAAAAVAPAISERSPAETAAVAEQVRVVAAEPVPAVEQVRVVEPLVVVGTFVRGPASSQCLPVPAAAVVD